MNDLPNNSNEDDVEQILNRLGPRPKPDAAMTQAVRANVMDAWQDEVRLTRRHRHLRVAAAVSAFAFAGLLAISSLKEPLPIVATIDASIEGKGSSTVSIQHSTNGEQWAPLDGNDLMVGDYLKTGSTAAASLTFATNMNVRLDHTTVIQINSPNSVKLSTGQVYLDSYGEASADGFIVETPFGIAADIGTQFMVKISDSDWSVQVREGLVNVQTDNAQLAVTPGQRVTLTPDSDVTKLAVLPTDASWQWVESVYPAYMIAGKSVDDYVHWVARETGRTVEYADDNQYQIATRTRLSGSQSIAGGSASDSLPYILQTTQLRLVELNDTLITIGAQPDD